MVLCQLHLHSCSYVLLVDVHLISVISTWSIWVQIHVNFFQKSRRIFSSNSWRKRWRNTLIWTIIRIISKRVQKRYPTYISYGNQEISVADILVWFCNAGIAIKIIIGSDSVKNIIIATQVSILCKLQAMSMRLLSLLKLKLIIWICIPKLLQLLQFIAAILLSISWLNFTMNSIYLFIANFNFFIVIIYLSFSFVVTFFRSILELLNFTWKQIILKDFF